MPKPGVVWSLCMCWGPTGCSWQCLRREHEAGSTVGRCSYKVCYSICSSPMDLQLVSFGTNTPSSMKTSFCTCALMRTICQGTPQIPCWHSDPLWCWSGSFSAIAPRLYVDRELWSLYLQTWACRGKTWILHISSMVRLASSCYQQTWSWFLIWRFGFQPQWGQCSTHKPSSSLHYPGLVFALPWCKDVLVSGKLSSNTSCNLCDLEVPYSWRSHRWCAHSCEFMCEAERMLIGGAKLSFCGSHKMITCCRIHTEMYEEQVTAANHPFMCAFQVHPTGS